MKKSIKSYGFSEIRVIEKVIGILNKIEDGGVRFTYSWKDLREYLLIELGIPEEEWPAMLDGRKMLTEEELRKLPQF